MCALIPALGLRALLAERLYDLRAVACPSSESSDDDDAHDSPWSDPIALNRDAAQSFVVTMWPLDALRDETQGKKESHPP